MHQAALYLGGRFHSAEKLISSWDSIVQEVLVSYEPVSSVPVRGTS